MRNYKPYKVKKSTPSRSTDPKSVAPMQRVYVNFPTGPFPSRLCYFTVYNKLLSNGGSFLGVLSKAFCALQTHLKFLQLFSGGGGSLYLLFGATG